MTELKKVTIYEMGGCCSTSLVSPQNYAELQRLEKNAADLKKQGIELLRVNVAMKPQVLTEEPALGEFLTNQSIEVFPVTVFNGKVVKSVQLPTQDELSAWTGGTFEQNTITGGCCGQ